MEKKNKTKNFCLNCRLKIQYIWRLSLGILSKTFLAHELRMHCQEKKLVYWIYTFYHGLGSCLKWESNPGQRVCRTLTYMEITDKWAATWQNQQCGCAPSEDSDQPGHPPSLIRVFVVRMKKPWVLSYPLSAQRRLWSDWADAQADLSLRWAHTHFVGFVMS